jgi:DNA-binding transcriptional MerR regulator
MAVADDPAAAGAASEPSSTDPEKSGLQAGPDDSAPEGLARIDQVSSRTGLTKRTLRYYEEIGLLEPPARTEGGYRLYTNADVRRLERIKRLKDLMGFSLAEIREFVRVEEEREQVRAAWQRETAPRVHLAQLDDAEGLVRQQLRLVEEKLTGLEEMRDSLRERLARYEQLRGELRAQLAQEG